jgi:aminopeptidase
MRCLNLNHGFIVSYGLYLFSHLRYALLMDAQLLKLATKNIGDMVGLALEHKAEQGERALVVYDTENDLTNILTAAYREVLPHAQYVDIASITKDEAIALFNTLLPRDLVVLIQTSSFRLDDFRIRLHLFKQKLKVIEHVHLYRNPKEQWETYINSLAYDPSWYRVVGRKLQSKLADCTDLRIESGDVTLTITGGLESPKPNLGDYAGMENIGGTFPIGEVFTEALDFKKMNGSFMVYAFAGGDFSVAMHEPFRVDVEAGIVVGWGDNAPQSFADIIASIKENERSLIREIGFGLNRAITREHYVNDITAFERILGLHLSMGEKHSVYKKEGIITHKARFHVDLFPLVDRITVNGEAIFEDGKYAV